MANAGVDKKKLEELKKKLDDDSLDLSMSELPDVSFVKELAGLTKMKKLNLSFNLLTSLPLDFPAKLGNSLRELDLSKNHLRLLPDNFGALVNLRSLDLLGNQLKSLPSSFSELKQLQWLDLKDNQLEPELNKVAGNCLDEQQCKKCATQVIRFTKVQAAKEEFQRQSQLKKLREEEHKKEEAELARIEQAKRLKKQEKEARRNANQQKQKKKEATESDSSSSVGDSPKKNLTQNQQQQHQQSSWWSSLVNLLMSVFRLLSISFTVFGIYLMLSGYCQSNKRAVRSAYPFLENLRSVTNIIDLHVCSRLNPMNRNFQLSYPPLTQLLEKFTRLR